VKNNRHFNDLALIQFFCLKSENRKTLFEALFIEVMDKYAFMFFYSKSLGDYHVFESALNEDTLFEMFYFMFLKSENYYQVVF